MERRLSAILAADVVGYSRLMEQDETATFERLRAHRKGLFEPEIAKHHGRIFKLMGDGLLAEFASVVDAVECAVTLQRGMAERNSDVADDERIDVRIGINLGDVIVEGDDRHGEGVNIAARLQQLAEPGGIAVSRTVCDHVKNKLALGFESLGDHHVRNIAAPVTVYRVAIAPHEPTADRPPSLLRPRHGKPAVAVLPFDNMSDDPTMSYFSDGVTEDIISMLSRLPDLAVIARNSTFVYKGKAVDVRQLGRELAVDYVLEGSVRKAHERVRIVAQLVDTRDGQHVWAERYDNEGSDPWALQDEVTAKIVASLSGERGQIRQAEYKQAWGKDTASLQEYDYYLRGHEIYMQAEGAAEHDRAGAIWGEGFAKFPESALLRVKLAWFHLTRALSFWSDDAAADYRRAGELGRQVLSSENLAPHTRRLAHWLMAFVHCREGDFAQALANAETAFALAPYDAFMLGGLSQVLIMAGKPGQAIAWLTKASADNPHGQELYKFRSGWAYYVLGDDEKSIAAMKDGPARLDITLFLASSFVRLGRMDEARAEVRRALMLDRCMSQAKWRERYVYSDQAILERQLADLGKAGLSDK